MAADRPSVQHEMDITDTEGRRGPTALPSGVKKAGAGTL